MHASGTDEDYVQKAIAEGVQLLGFSDHAPYPYREGYVSYYKMKPAEIEGYFASVRSLAEKYAGKIELRVGYEAELYPDLWSDALALWKLSPPDYLILGQHFTDFEFRGGHLGDSSYRPATPAGSTERSERERLARYVDTVMSALATERFSCVAHPDIISFAGDVDFYREQMLRLIEAARRAAVPLEFNLLGFSEGRLYPRREFWELAASVGASAVIGCDAHSPARVADPAELAAAHAFLSSLGVPVLEEIELRKPFK